MQDLLEAIPPITKILGFSVFLFSLITSLHLVPPSFVVFDPKLAIYDFEIWRFFSGLLYHGKFSFSLFVYIIYSFSILMKLENSKFRTRSSQLVFIIILMGIIDLCLSGLISSLDCARSLMCSLIYLYGKLMSDARVMLFVNIPVPAQYIPFISLLLSIFNEARLKAELIGIVTGHIVFYLLYILPVATNTNIFKTPKILIRIFD